MAIVAVTEVIPRTYSHRIGDSPTADRTFKVTVDGPTSQKAAIEACGISHGAAHPEFTKLKCQTFSVTEPDLFHIEVTASYGIQPGQDQEDGAIPWQQPDQWSFSSTSGQVALTTHFENIDVDPKPGNNTIEFLLTNTANDPYEGLTKPEPLLRATVTGYRQTFPLQLAASVTTAINNAAFAGGEKHTWQCLGISATPEFGEIAGLQQQYWQIRSELIYRRSTHNLKLPNVGLHYLEDGNPIKKTRCWVIDSETGDRVPSAGPLALETNGDLKQIGAGPYPPDQHRFRIFPEVNFSQFFGNPPASVI